MMADIVFPVRVKKDQGKMVKYPAIPKGTSWKDYPLLSKEQSYEHPHIGISPPEGALIIDIDTYKGISRDDVEAALNGQGKINWKESFLQNTPSGGEHHLFNYNPDEYHITKQLDALGVKGLDIIVHGSGWIATGNSYGDSENIFDSVYEEVIENFKDWPHLPADVAASLQAKHKAVSGIVSGDELIGYEDNDSVKDGSVEAFTKFDENQPIEDITDTEVINTLKHLPDEWVEDYGNWYKVAAAVNHQYQGGDTGLKIFDSWSSTSEKYDKDKVKAKYESFTNNQHDNAFKFGSLIYHSKYDRFKSRSTGLFDNLKVLARDLDSETSYQALINRISELTNKELSVARRDKLAAIMEKSSYGNASDLKQKFIKAELKSEASKEDEQEQSIKNIGVVPNWAKHWVFNQENDKFYHTIQKREVTRVGFCAEFQREPEVKAAGGVGPCALALDFWKIPIVVDRIYYPGKNAIIEMDSLLYVNTYRDNGAKLTGGNGLDENGEYTDLGKIAVDTFKNHLDVLMPIKDERDYFLHYLAKVTRDLGCKIPHALLLRGAEMDGKTYFYRLMKRIIGTNNTLTIDGSELSSDFNKWKEGNRLLFVEEVYVEGKEKYQTHNKMKTAISNTEVRVRRMNTDGYTTKNFTNYIMFTNFKDAVPITHSDTRYYVIFTRFNSKDDVVNFHGGEDGNQKYYTELYATLEYAAAIKKYLMEFAIPADFGIGRAVLSPSKSRMLKMVESLSGGTLKQLMIENECEVFNTNIISLELLWRLTGCNHNDRLGRKLLHEMKHEGFEAGKQLSINGGRQRAWTKDISDEDCEVAMRNYYYEIHDFDK